MKFINYNLSAHTTFKIGGQVDVYSIPETLAELSEELVKCRMTNTRTRIIGNGSNLLLGKRIEGHVISLEKCASNLDVDPAGLVAAGAGVPLSRFVNSCIENNLYGNEFLASVPGTIGGAVYMNAGTWIDQNLFISDYLTEVLVLDGDKIFTLGKSDCEFSYRRSVFHSRLDWVILEARFRLAFQLRSVGFAKRKARLSWSKSNQDTRYGNAGSIFRECNGHVLCRMKGFRLARAGWSPLTGNWINNYGGASYLNVIILILLFQFTSNLFGSKAKLEIVTWRR